MATTPAALPRAAIPSMRPSSHVACGACGLNPLCHPANGASGTPHPVEGRRRLAHGEVLFTAGAPRRSVYALRAGYLKLMVPDGAGGLHIARFLLPGDVVGLDGFATGVHQTTAVALGDCEVCEVPAHRAEMLADNSPCASAHIRALVARELARAQEHAATLARLTASQRVAMLLREFSRRWIERGYSGTEFRLPMGRREIGEHLGLTMETVSRIFSAMRVRGWVRLTRGGIEILRPEELETLTADYDYGTPRAAA